MSTVPFTAWDLREIAKRLAKWDRLLTREGEYTDLSNLVSRIEVHRPDDTGEIIGHFVMLDGWVGFEFNKEEK